MLAKLAVRNIKRSIQDYVLYVITITFILALVFAFNSMMFSDLILGMNAHMTDYRMLLVLFSVIVLIVVSWLINYMTRFMLERRSREFGTYLILGMENKTVSKLFFYENVIFGVISLILGCFLGSFIFQGLLFVISSFFGEEYKVEADFSLAALFLTILYYLLIQFLVVFRNNQYLKKLKIKDLMNADKVNEQVKVKHVKRNVILFLVSIVALLVACSKAPVIVVIICMIVFIYCFYIGISGIMVLLIQKSKRFKYKKLNVFVFRQLSSKINTMGFTMGTIAVLFTLALLSSNYAIGLSNFKGEIEKHAPFDICVTDLDAGENFSEVREMLKEDGWIKNDLVYSIYRSEDAKFTNVLKNNQVLGGYFQYDTYMRVSDYNVLRGFLGLEEVTLNDKEYLIHSVASVSNYYEEWVKVNSEIELNGTLYQCKGIYDEDFAQNGQNGAGYIVIVPDDVVENMEVYYSQYACDTLKETNNDLYLKILEFVTQDAENWATSAEGEDELDHGMGIDSVYVIYDNVMVKNGGTVSEVEAAIITVVASIFYVALVFICVALTILAVQQLSDASKYKFRYKVLNHLGVNEHQKSKLILKQLLIYFGFPIIIPVMISMVISFKLNQVMLMGTQIQSDNYSFFGLALVLFLIVYGIYFSVTYINFKRNIEVG